MNKTKFTDYKAVIRGEVKVSSLIDGKVISERQMHNTATANMLIGIARFLRGDFFHVSTQSETFLPMYLGVGYISSKSTDGITTSANDVGLKAEYSDLIATRFDVSKGNIEVNSEGEVRLQLSAVIPSGSFAADTKINELGLFSKRSTNDKGLLARVVMLDNKSVPAEDDTNGIVIKRNQSERIDWTIVLSNK